MKDGGVDYMGSIDEVKENRPDVFESLFEVE
jgi:hypothetical protein